MIDERHGSVLSATERGSVDAGGRHQSPPGISFFDQQRTSEAIMLGWNFCPYCGHRRYQHGRKGCEHVETVGHVVKIKPDGSFTLKHPLSERENDRLFDCKIHNDLQTPDLGLPKDGEWSIIENSEGGWGFEPPDKAREQCACKKVML
jgi:hypothetical protein